MTLILKQQFLVFLLVGRLIGLHMSTNGSINVFLMIIQRKSKNGNKGTVAHISIDKATPSSVRTHGTGVVAESEERVYY